MLMKNAVKWSENLYNRTDNNRKFRNYFIYVNVKQINT